MIDTIRGTMPNDVLRWPDGTWMYREDYNWLIEHGFSSPKPIEGHEVFTHLHPEYDLIVGLEKA